MGDNIIYTSADFKMWLSLLLTKTGSGGILVVPTSS